MVELMLKLEKMTTSNVEETTALIDNDDIPKTVRNTRRLYQKQLSVHLILASILFSLAALYSLDINVANNLSFDKKLNWTRSHSVYAEDIFDGIHLLAMLIFGILGDAKLTRARAIIIGFPLYLIGYTLYTLITSGKTFVCLVNESNRENVTSMGNEKCAPIVLGSLILIAIGDGAVMSNLIVFGADQISESMATSRYCDKLVVVIHAADALRNLCEIIFLHNKDYFHFFVVNVSMLFLAVLLFLFGWKYYTHVEAYDSAIMNCIPVYKNAFQTWRQRNTETKLMNSTKENVENTPDSVANEEKPTRFLDFAKVINHGKFNERIVEDVKLFQNAMIIFILILPFWIIFAQIYSTFPAQVESMKLIGTFYATDISNMMLIIEHITFFIGILILNIFVYKYLEARNRSLTIPTKFIISMCFSCLTMCIAGGIEILRQDYCPTNGDHSNLSLYFQIPQYIILGFSQIFGLLASIEFAYFIAPRSAKSLFMSLYYFSRILAQYIVDGYMTYLSTTSSKLDFSCQSNEQWRTYGYFFIFASLQIVFTIIFIVCQRYYQMIKLRQ